MERFYIPAMSASVSYDRAVGYFSSSALAIAARGLFALVKNGGRMRLVASPYLSEEDRDAIVLGLRARDSVLLESLSSTLLLDELGQIMQDRIKVLSWLLHRGLLEVQLAWKSDGGLYHEKLGIFRDAYGDFVAFSGSANESRNAFFDNYEAIDVYRSWIDKDAERAEEKSHRFAQLWNNQRPGAQVVCFSEQLVKAQVLSDVPREELPTSDEWVPESTSVHEGAVGPQEQGGGKRAWNGPTLRNYQKEALRNWLSLGLGGQRTGCTGILKHATGSGKTLTALAGMKFLLDEGVVSAAVVVCPYLHLVEQWIEQLRRLGFVPVACCDEARGWFPRAADTLLRLQRGEIQEAVLVATAATLMSAHFQTLLKRLEASGAEMLVVADEVHNFGTKRSIESLPPFARHRLGLSATPERYLDPEGTQRIFDYFGAVLSPAIDLGQALSMGVLRHYEYFPIFVDLEEDELEDYRDLSTRIARLMAIGAKASQDGSREQLERLLIRRARLIGGARGKYRALTRWLGSEAMSADPKHTLIYAPEGEVDWCDGDRRGAVAVILDAVRGGGHTAEPFVESTTGRRELLERFAEGDPEFLVSMRCLDEGVDVPATSTALILASSRNPRQFIQRRGRLLRLGGSERVARIYDTVVVPALSSTPPERLFRGLVRGELLRALEFASLADNRIQAESAFLPYQSAYQLFSVGVDDSVEFVLEDS